MLLGKIRHKLWHHKHYGFLPRSYDLKALLGKGGEGRGGVMSPHNEQSLVAWLRRTYKLKHFSQYDRNISSRPPIVETKIPHRSNFSPVNDKPSLIAGNIGCHVLSYIWSGCTKYNHVCYGETFSSQRSQNRLTFPPADLECLCLFNSACRAFASAESIFIPLKLQTASGELRKQLAAEARNLRLHVRQFVMEFPVFSFKRELLYI